MALDLSLFTDVDIPTIDTDEKIPNYYLKYNYQNNELSEKYLQDIFQKYGIIIKIPDFELFKQAFTHISYCCDTNNINMIINEGTNITQIDKDISDNKLVEIKHVCNSKLEWLGDAIVGMAVSYYLIHRYPNKDEGFLTKLRSSISNCDSLAEIARKLNLQKYLLISNYIESINGRNNINRLQELFKSLVACIDIQFDMNHRNNFIINILESLINIPDRIINDTNYKDILLRYYQKNQLSKPVFRSEMIEGATNNRIFTMAVVDNNNDIMGIGKDTVKKKAEQNASREALRGIGLLSENNIVQWTYTKPTIDYKQLKKGIPLFYYKYNPKNSYITTSIIKNLLTKYGITEDFNDLTLYQTAFIHKSYCLTHSTKYELNYTNELTVDKTNIDIQLKNNTIVKLQDKSYEQLEWYGDSVLKYTITKYLLNRYPDKQDGFLTDIRSKLTNSHTLYQIGKTLEFDKYIVISQYEEHINSRNNQSNLEDVTEAFLGALMTDLGEKITEQFIINIFENIVDIADKIQNNNNYKDILLRYYQKQQWGHPKYKQLSVEQTKISSHHYCNIYTVAVYNHDGTDTVGIGKGKSKKTAEQLASKNTLIYYDYFDEIDKLKE